MAWGVRNEGQPREGKSSKGQHNGDFIAKPDSDKHKKKRNKGELGDD